MKTIKGFAIFYFILSAAEIFGEVTESLQLVYFTKPLLTISLGCFYMFRKNRAEPTKNRLVMTALVFALAGDSLLMIRGIDLFIPGLAAFLMMQWLYIFTFRLEIRRRIFSSTQLVMLLPFLAFAAVLFLLLSLHLEDPIMLFAICIYAISIAIMVWMALLRSTSVARQPFIYVFSGALLFMLSDSLIAIDRFISPIPYDSVLVMSTYVTAQFLITIGLLVKSQAEI